jgi:hypothetical protein
MAIGEGPGTEGGATGEAAEGFGGDISGPDTNGGGGGGSGPDAHEWGGKVSENISANMQAAQSQAARDKDPENFDPMGSAHAGQFDYYGGIDMDSQFGQPTGAKPAFTDAQYRDKGWVPGKALTYTDEQGKTQLATLEAHENRMELSELEALRQQAYAAKNAQQGWDVPFFGKVNEETVGKMAFNAMDVTGVAGIGSAFLGMISQPYSEKYSGTAAQRAALGYYGPGIPTGMPNVGPFMDPVDRNWDDARWSDDFDPEKGARVDSQGNIVDSPTSPAGGEVITVAAPPGAPDQRVTQFKALYPAEWTETLTDEEIIAMVDNPDQLRYWLSWRQT